MNREWTIPIVAVWTVKDLLNQDNTKALTTSKFNNKMSTVIIRLLLKNHKWTGPTLTSTT